MEEAQGPGHVSQGARCAIHYGQPFTAVCQRCGTYMCRSCTEGGTFSVCPACRTRTGIGSFPLRRDAFTWGEVLRLAWDAYKKNWALLLVSVVITLVLSSLVQGVTMLLQTIMMDRLDILLMLQALLILPQMALQGLLTLGLMSVGVKLVRGEPVTLGMLFGEWRKLGSFLLQVLVMMAAAIPLVLLFTVPFMVGIFSAAGENDLGLGSMLLVIPLGVAVFFYLGLGVAFANLEIVAQPSIGAIDGIRNAWSIARGQRLAILLAGILALGTIFVGMFACFVGLFFAYGFAIVLFATVYLTLRNGADRLVA